VICTNRKSSKVTPSISNGLSHTTIKQGKFGKKQQLFHFFYERLLHVLTTTAEHVPNEHELAKFIFIVASSSCRHANYNKYLGF